MERQPKNNKDLAEPTLKSSTSNSISPCQEVNSIQSQSHSSAQSETSHSSNASFRSNLIARWEIENGKLVCRWIINDRPRHSSTQNHLKDENEQNRLRPTPPKAVE